jgi:demethylmenaquinone methyltransferase/2-methoxy-6-polyprenyl-1,4-benzoquinol methylase
MFARIAGRYDLLNRTLSLGVDRRWRRQAVRAAGAVRGSLVVDACCGTGDLARDFARAGARVVGVDFTGEMLERALPKLEPLEPGHLLVQGDALELPLRDGCADIASVAFGLRNLADRSRGLAELARVVRPGGLVLVLEFTAPPPGAFGALFRFYFTRILPRVGGLISGDAAAYRYLPDTVLAWPSPEALRGDMERAGLERCGFQKLGGGIACLHWGSPKGDAAGER